MKIETLSILLLFELAQAVGVSRDSIAPPNANCDSSSSIYLINNGNVQVQIDSVFMIRMGSPLCRELIFSTVNPVQSQVYFPPFAGTDTLKLRINNWPQTNRTIAPHDSLLLCGFIIGSCLICDASIPTNSCLNQLIFYASDNSNTSLVVYLPGPVGVLELHRQSSGVGLRSRTENKQYNLQGRLLQAHRQQIEAVRIPTKIHD
jgi:hypothetical protein